VASMDKLETLVVVDVDFPLLFMGLNSLDPQKVICPSLRRLIIRCDLVRHCISWGDVAGIMETRAALGSPIEWVTLTSSFNELPGGHTPSVEFFEGIAGVRYDLGRGASGWEWWKE